VDRVLGSRGGVCGDSFGGGGGRACGDSFGGGGGGCGGGMGGEQTTMRGGMGVSRPREAEPCTRCGRLQYVLKE
jgi:hypothetical protein